MDNELRLDEAVAEPRWQRARILKADAMPKIVGCLVWCEVGRITKCNSFCDIPSIFVNHEFDSPFGPGQDAMHLDALEMLSEFSNDVPMLSWSQFVAECRASKESPQCSTRS